MLWSKIVYHPFKKKNPVEQQQSLSTVTIFGKQLELNTAYRHFYTVKIKRSNPQYLFQGILLVHYSPYSFSFAIYCFPFQLSARDAEEESDLKALLRWRRLADELKNSEEGLQILRCVGASGLRLYCLEAHL